MKCEYWIVLGWIVAYIITVTCVTLWPVVLIILIMILLYGCCILKYIFTSMSVKDWLNKNWIFVTMSIVLVFFFILWNKGVICIHAIANANLNSKDEAELSYNIVNTISGILTPIFTFIALFVACKTFFEDRDNNKKTLQQQQKEQFKDEFFNMLEMQKVLLNEIKGTFSFRFTKGAIVTGDNYFSIAREELNIVFKILENQEIESKDLKYNITQRYKLADIKNYSNLELKTQIREFYSAFYNVHPELGTYFRHMYHILKKLKFEEDRLKNVYSENKDDAKNEIKEYSDILQATLTEDELFFVNYNCFCFEKTKELVNNFDFLGNLSNDKLIKESHHLKNFN